MRMCIMQPLFSLNCGMRIRTLFLIALMSSAGAFAQSNDFCEAVEAVMNDAPSGFTNIKGKMLDMNANATMWASTVKIPGSIGYRIVHSMGVFYESGLAQSTNKDDVIPKYLEYKKKLTDCLAPLGYTLSTQENYVAGLSEYKKLVFMKEVPEDTPRDKMPAHVTMELMYSKEVGKFTLGMFIFKY